jgi:hypothetical protein
VAARKKARVRKRGTKRPGQRVTAKQRANLKPTAPGEVRNPKGNNQYTGLRAIREKALKVIDDNFDSLSKKAVQMAEHGDTTMMKFLLQAGYEVRALQVLDDDGKALDFAALAKRARDLK